MEGKNENTNECKGSLEVIIGCMFSGKSSELMRRIRLDRMLGRKVMVVNHSLDVRFGKSKVSSHDCVQEDCVTHSALCDVFQEEYYQEADSIFIDEGQFFKDLFHFVQLSVEVHNKRVVVSALDGNYKREPFMNVMQLIPFADDVIKISALCTVCKNGTKAVFSKRTIDCSNDTLIGGADAYACVCRKHYLNGVRS